MESRVNDQKAFLRRRWVVCYVIYTMQSMPQLKLTFTMSLKRFVPSKICKCCGLEVNCGDFLSACEFFDTLPIKKQALCPLSSDLGGPVTCFNQW